MAEFMMAADIAKQQKKMNLVFGPSPLALNLVCPLPPAPRPSPPVPHANLGYISEQRPRGRLLHAPRV